MDYISAESGEKALAMLDDTMVDGMLVDISLLPGMTGIEFMQEVRKMDRFEGVPIVAVTAHALQQDRDKYLAEGFNDYLSKPFDMAQLKEIVQNNF